MILKGKNDTLLIIIHGYKGSNEDYAIKQLSLELNKKGYPILAPNLISNKNKESETNIQNQVEKVNISIDQFKGKFKKIILVGGSLGGLVSKIAAANNSSVDGLVTLNGFFYFSGLKRNDLKVALKLFLTFPFNKDSRKTLLFYYKNLSHKKVKIPTLVISSKSDERISYNQSERFYKSLNSQKKLVFIKNMDHGITKKEYIIKVTEEIISWLRKL
ncbi:prolyl oligopeptidase family serine peptidase [Candidatus Roizmanbacteria bacterium]|nr:prolyl oligopeptidase family serine peptidase [Candidatus Roizmanbacteria bacterium]